MENSPLLSSTEYRDPARETQLLLRVLNATVGDVDADELAIGTMRAILEAVAVDLAFYLLIDPEPPRLGVSHPLNVPQLLLQTVEGLALPPGFFGQAADPQAGGAALSNLGDDLRSLLAEHGYARCVTIPLLSGHHGLGLLALARRKRDGSDWAPFAQQDFLEAIGTAIGTALQRARLADRLSASEEKYRSFIEGSPEGFLESAPDGTVTLANRAALEMIGYTREEVLGKVFDILGIEEKSSAQEWRDRLLKRGYVLDERVTFRAKDGSLKTANLTIRAVRDAAGRVVKYQTSARDVTARVLAEEELQRHLSELAAIARIGELIARSVDPEEPLREIANEICAILHADSVSIQLDEGDSMRVVLSSVEESGLIPLVDYHRQILAGFEPRVVPNSNDPNLDEGQRAALSDLGFASSVGVRLFAQGIALGILFVNQRTARQWTPDEIRLISTFARQIAGTMYTTKLLGEMRARVRELEGVAEMSAFAASMIGEERLVGRALDLTKELLGVDIIAVHLLDGQRFRAPLMLGSRLVKAEPLEMTPLLREIIESLKPFVFDGIRVLPSDKQAQSRVSGESARASIAVPLVSATGVLGILTVTRRDDHVWTQAEVRSVQTIANQLATGISNSRLFESLQQEREELEATWNSVFSGLFTTDERGIIRTWNRAAAEMTGYGAEAMRGKNWTEIARVRNDKPDILIFEAMAGGDVAFGLAPRTMTTADGRVIPLREAAAPLRDQMGKVRGAVGAFWDRTKEETAERARLDFLHEVSHELRNTLTAVLAMASMLRDQKVQGATRASAIRVLSDQVDRLKAFSLRFLQFEQEQLLEPPQEESMDLGRELERFVAAARLEYPNHEFALVGEAVEAHADRGRLETVIMNLLGNAAKFSPPGSSISIEAKSISGGRIGIAIRNDGPGIPAHDLDHIFERGYRGSMEGVGWMADGTGVGLWLAETKMHEMGGEICVHNDEEQGVTFTLTLRQARDKHAQEQTANPDRRRRQSGAGRARRPPRARRV